MTANGQKGKGHLRVLVVDDSAYNRKMIGNMLLDMKEVDKVVAVSDGEEAIRLVMTEPPDAITLDLNMPRMDGFTFLRWLMRNHPLPVVVVSSEGGEKNVFKALDLGALDFIVKPVRHASERIVEIQNELQEKIKAIAGKDLGPYLNRLKAKKAVSSGASARDQKLSSGTRESRGVLVIGASTGGPSAVQRVLSELPRNFPLPVVVVQHMPPVFTRQFAMRLGRNTDLEAREAVDGDLLEAGTVLVVPGGHHLVFREEGKPAVKVFERKETDRFVPSVDMTMTSAAKVFHAMAMGVLLTGMGNDGAEGLLRIKEAGGVTIAESEESAVVYGMPRAAVKKGATSQIYHIDRIGTTILELTGSVIGLKNARSDGTK